MSSAQATVFQKHRSANDAGGDGAWAARVAARALRCSTDHGGRDVESEFELAEADRALWRLLHLPRRYADLERCGLLPPEEMRAALRAFVAADVVEVIDVDQAKALLPAEVKKARAEAAGKSWRPAAGSLVAKVYRPDIDGGAASAEGGAGSTGDGPVKSPPAPTSPGLSAPRTSTGGATAAPPTSPGLNAPRTSTGGATAPPPTSPGLNAPRTSTGGATAPPPTSPGLNAPRTSTGGATAAPPMSPGLNAPRTSTGGAAAGGTPAAAPAAIGNRTLLPEEKTTYTHLAQAFASMNKIDHYAFLGVPTTAEEPAIRAAYVGLARDYHPDRIAGSALGDDPQVRSWIEALFKRLGEAQKTLMNAESRARYDREQKALAASPSGEATTSSGRQRRPIEARNAFIMAETFLKKKDFAQAELHYRQASNFDPEEGLIAVGLAWCIFLNPDQPAEKRHAEARRRLEEAVKKFKVGDASYKLGRVLREMGDEEGAAKCFEEALRRAPNHVDAQREVRIVEMRRQKAEADKAETAQKAGLLGKLFKR